MSFFSKLFAFKFHWVTDLFNAMQHGWNHLTEAEQSISLKASGIIAIINANADLVPEEVFKLIQVKFPDVTPEFVHDTLSKAADFLKIGDDAAQLSFQDAIKVFQAHLKDVTGNTWIAKTQHAVGALLTVLLPDTSPLNKVTTILEFIYEHFVKGKIA